MSRKTHTTSYVLLIIAVAVIAWAFFHRTTPRAVPLATSDTTQSETTSPEAAPQTYNNEAYAFSVTYPGSITLVEQFATFYTVQDKWRINAPETSRGTAVVAIPTISFDQGGVATGKTYPLFYDAEVRVGVSSDVARCFATDQGYENQTVTTVVINGVNFKRFSFADAAMMKYLEGESYRTIHDGKCYAVERFRTGSSYRDDTMTDGQGQETLDAAYAQTLDIVKSFAFTD